MLLLVVGVCCLIFDGSLMLIAGFRVWFGWFVAFGVMIGCDLLGFGFGFKCSSGLCLDSYLILLSFFLCYYFDIYWFGGLGYFVMW